MSNDRERLESKLRLELTRLEGDAEAAISRGDESAMRELIDAVQKISEPKSYRHDIYRDGDGFAEYIISIPLP